MTRSAAERQRERRRRQRQGAIMVTIEVKPRSREVLAEAQWVKQWDEDSPAAVTAAVQHLVDNLSIDGGAEE